MTELTPRQIDLLKLIIREYTESADPVGSEILEKKYHLGVSPATIRNDMVSLTKHGYLEKAYFSAGRVPTSKAFRFYIKYLMEEKELSTADEVSSKK
ncbi:MAG: Heat-inducible transcription repressor HrcA [Microgenomates bacterium OLB22]|nr:MAG: Heat-inducible transcription repressor HrcA [Microgenomates bacterium OLB22]